MKRVIAFIFFCFISFSSFAQYSFQKEKEKYWVYRERLKNFMVRSHGGVCKGCDIIANGRDNYNPDVDVINWADTPWFIGYWIGTLAMEYQLLTAAGLSSTSIEVMQTKEDLYAAIQSINRLDWEAEISWGCSQCGGNPASPCPQNLNGFILDDDIPSDFSQIQSIVDQLNEGLVPPPDDYRDRCIASAYTDYITPGRECSLDHLIGLFMGLTLVKKCLPPSESWNNNLFIDELGNTTSFVREVQIISKRITNYLHTQSWIYMNPCANRCVIGINNPKNYNACHYPGAQDNCSYPKCCSDGGAFAQPEAIGFAATNQFIQGSGNDPILASLVSNPIYTIAWNLAINDGNRLPITLAALGNVWKVGICTQYYQQHICIGIPFYCNCCVVDQYVSIPYPAPCSFTTSDISDFLVNKGLNNNWQHLYLLHRFLYGAGSSNISNAYYECLLNAAPCRGYDGNINSPNIEWSDIDRLAGQRGGNYSSSFSKVDYMFYFNIYNLNNPQAGYPYNSLPIRQLAPLDLLKSNYTEYDKKNFIAANSIAANSYSISNSISEGQGRVTFASGGGILLGNGFKVTNGAYFHGFIDPTIGVMNCSDPPSQTDCAGLRSFNIINDTITDADSIIIKVELDTLTSILPCPIDTLQLQAKNIIKNAKYFKWDFGNGQTSEVENPSVFYSYSGIFTITLIATKRSGKINTFSFPIIVPDCKNIQFERIPKSN
ncbi:MAG: PKD domain-containing protein [Saprospiraceae bacterium]